jgi:outer membrane protein assembly factor BamB
MGVFNFRGDEMAKIHQVKMLLLLTAVQTFPLFAAAQDSSRWLVPLSLAEKSRLKILWQHNLPINASEKLERLVILGDRVYALSSRNFLTSLNRNTGAVQFSAFVAPSGIPLGELQLYGDQLFCIIGNEFIQLNTEFGTRQSGHRFDYGVVCPVARNASNLYVAGADRRVHAIRAKDGVQVFEAAAENNSAITAIIADDNSVIFATADANVVCMAADGPRKLWQFNAAAPIAAGLVRDAQTLFLASKDTNIYKLDLASGELLWKYQTEAILEDSPQAGKSAVYQHVPNVGLTAIDKDTGKFLWQVKAGLGLLAESGDKSYVLTDSGVLVVMDNKKAKQVTTVDFGGTLEFAANLADSKLYIADRSGRLACLQPID